MLLPAPLFAAPTTRLHPAGAGCCCRRYLYLIVTTQMLVAVVYSIAILGRGLEVIGTRTTLLSAPDSTSPSAQHPASAWRVGGPPPIMDDWGGASGAEAAHRGGGGVSPPTRLLPPENAQREM